jgi:hypothetical protein
MSAMFMCTLRRRGKVVCFDKYKRKGRKRGLVTTPKFSLALSVFLSQSPGDHVCGVCFSCVIIHGDCQ